MEPLRRDTAIVSLHQQTVALAGVLSRVDDDGSHAAALRAVADLLADVGVEATARVLASWPGNLAVETQALFAAATLTSTRDDVEHKQRDQQLQLRRHQQQRDALRILSSVYAVGVSVSQLQHLLDATNPGSSRFASGCRNAVVAALASASEASGSRGAAPSAFWSFPGCAHDAPRYRGAFVSSASPARVDLLPVRSGHLTLSWPRWPFQREYGLWTLVRVTRFGGSSPLSEGASDDRTMLLRFVGGSGASLTVWLTPGTVHVNVYDPAPTSAATTPSAAGGVAAGAGEFIGKAASRAFATAAAVRDRLQAVATGVGVTAAASAAAVGGGTTATAICPEVATGRWFSLHVHHERRTGLLGAPIHELVVSVNGVEALRTTELPFPRGLGSSPLALARVGDGLEGEMGPLYFWGDDRHGPLSPREQMALVAAHTGDAVQLAPPLLSVASGSGPGDDDSASGDILRRGLYALYHPAAVSAPHPRGGVITSSLIDGAAPPVSCECPDVAGGSASAVLGLYGVAAFAGTPLRDALAAVGGLSVLLPLMAPCVPAAILQQRRARLLGARAAADAGSTARDCWGDSDLAAVGRVAARAAASLPRDAGGDDADIWPWPPFGGAAAPMRAQPNGDDSLSPSIAANVIHLIASMLRGHASNVAAAARLSLFSLLRFELEGHLLPASAASAAHRSVAAASELDDVAATSDEPGVTDGLAAYARAVAAARLRRPGAAVLDPHLVNALMSLAAVAAPYPEIAGQVWRVIIADARLFARCNYSVQIALVVELQAAARSAPEFFRAEIGVAALVCSLEEWWHAVSLAQRCAERAAVAAAALQRDEVASGDFPLDTASTSGPGIPSTSISQRIFADTWPVLSTNESAELLEMHFRLIACVLGAGTAVRHSRAEEMLSSAAFGLAHSTTGDSRHTLSALPPLHPRHDAAALAAAAAVGHGSIAIMAPPAVHALRRRDVEPLLQCIVNAAASSLPGPREDSKAHDAVDSATSGAIVNEASGAIFSERDNGDGHNTVTVASPHPSAKSNIRKGERRANDDNDEGGSSAAVDDALHAAALTLVAALFDFEASHVGGDSGHALAAAVSSVEHDASRRRRHVAAVSTSAGTSPAAATDSARFADPHVLLSSGSLGALSAFDAAAGGDFISIILFNSLPYARTPAVAAAALRAIIAGLRVNAARPGRWRDGTASSGVRPPPRGVPSSRDRLQATLAAAVDASALAWSGDAVPAIDPALSGNTAVAPGAPFPGALWARDFAALHGFHMMYYMLRDAPCTVRRASEPHGDASAFGLPEELYDALWAAAFDAPDSIEAIVVLELDASNEARVSVDAIASASLSSRGLHSRRRGATAAAQRARERFLQTPRAVIAPTPDAAGAAVAADATDDATAPTSRATGFRAALMHGSAAAAALDTMRAKDSSAGTNGDHQGTLPMLPAGEPVLTAPGALQLLLRMMPHMTNALLLRAFTDLHAVLRRSEGARRTLICYVPGWEVQLARALLPIEPTRVTFPATLGSTTEGELWAQLGADESIAPASGAHVAGDLVNALWAAGEGLILFATRAALDYPGGWRSFQRLLALQPLLCDDDAGDADVSGDLHMPKVGTDDHSIDGRDRTTQVPTPGISSVGAHSGSWARRPPAYSSALERRGRRLLALTIGAAIADFHSLRTRTAHRVHVDNLIHLTALIEREVGKTPVSSAVNRLHDHSGNMLDIAASPLHQSDSESASMAAGRIEGVTRPQTLPKQRFTRPLTVVAESRSEYQSEGEAADSQESDGHGVGESLDEYGDNQESDDGAGSDADAEGTGAASLDDEATGSISKSDSDANGKQMLTRARTGSPNSAALLHENSTSERSTAAPPVPQTPFTSPTHAKLRPTQLRGWRTPSGRVTAYPLTSPRPMRYTAHVANPVLVVDAIPTSITGGEDGDDSASHAKHQLSSDISSPVVQRIKLAAFTGSGMPTTAVPDGAIEGCKDVPRSHVLLRQCYDGFLVISVLSLWNRFLAVSSSDAASRFLSIIPSGAPHAGDMRILLLVLSQWLVRREIESLSPPRLHSARSMVSNIDGDAVLALSCLHRVLLPILTEAGDRLATAEVAAASVPGAGFGPDWDAAAGSGRAGIPAEYWVCSTLWVINNLLRRIAAHGGHRASIDGPLASQCARVLGDIFTMCPAVAAAAHVDIRPLQAFLEGYELACAAVAARRRRHATGRRDTGMSTAASFSDDEDDNHSADDANADFALRLAADWLCGDVRVGGIASPAAVLSSVTSTAAAPSSSWVRQPEWTPLVQRSLDCVAQAASAAHSDVDTTMDRVWRGLLHLFRSDIGVYRPMRVLRARQARLLAIERDSRAGVAADNARRGSGAGSSLTNAQYLLNNVPAAAAAALSAALPLGILGTLGTLTPAVASSALRRFVMNTVTGGGVRERLAAVRQGVTRRIAGGLAALSQVFDSDATLNSATAAAAVAAAADDAAASGLGGPSADELAAIERAYTRWLPHSVVAAVGVIRVIDPGWGTLGGAGTSHSAHRAITNIAPSAWGRAAIASIEAFVATLSASHHVRNAAARRHIDTIRGVTAARHRLLRGLVGSGGAWMGNTAADASSVNGLPLRVSSKEDGWRRRCWLVDDDTAPDFSRASHRGHGGTAARVVQPLSIPATPLQPIANVVAQSQDASREDHLPPLENRPQGAPFPTQLLESTAVDATLQAKELGVAFATNTIVTDDEALHHANYNDATLPQRELLSRVARAVAAAAAARLPLRRNRSAQPSDNNGTNTSAAAIKDAVDDTNDDDDDDDNDGNGNADSTSSTVMPSSIITLANCSEYPADNDNDDDETDEDAKGSQSYPVAGFSAGDVVASSNIQPVVASPTRKRSDASAALASTLATPVAVDSPGFDLLLALAAAAPTGDGVPTSVSLLPGEIVVLEVPARRIAPRGVTAGRVLVTSLHLIFHPATDASNSHGIVLDDGENDQLPEGSVARARNVGTAPPSVALRPRRWAWRLCTRLLPRRYLLQPCALELFFAGGSPPVMLAFPALQQRAVFDAIWAQRPPRLVASGCPRTLVPRKHLVAAKLTDAWTRRQLSNYDYLMALNTLAGRSFNDLTQYPVMPWVLADYSSPTLDLNSPASYRDLSKPVGALNSRRIQLFRERMEGLVSADGDATSIPPFLYGSHYSSAGVVLFYLLRLQPWTSLALEQQGGRFDVPDRLFFSIPEVWRGVNSSMSDVKELTPEWFTTPAMFGEPRTTTHAVLPLGELQEGNRAVTGVTLPPWARTPEEFVWLHRAALESEMVSAHLHEWIDLIFGYKQRGDAALAADNLFYYLTYEDAVDLRSITDATTRASTIAQIVHFGQTPGQLFRKPHPPRDPLDAVDLPLVGFDAPLQRV